MSARSTGRSAVTVTVPVARSTATDSTPSTAAISSVTARRQWAQVMPVTVKVVEPMKVRGVLDSMGTPRRRVVVRSGTRIAAAAGPSHRGNRRDLPGIGARVAAPGPVRSGRYGRARAGRTGPRTRGDRRPARRRPHRVRWSAGGPRRRRVRQVHAAGRRRDRRLRDAGAAHLRRGVGVPAGLRRAAAAAVAAARPDRDPAGTPAGGDRLVAATGGNPLALGELAAALTGDQLSGRAPLPAPLPLTEGVERGFLDRHRRLSPAAQRLLLVTAADDTARLSVVRGAAERLGAGDEALDEAERTGLVHVDGDTVVLYHPLVRSAVYRAATSAQRRAAHRALADVLHADADRRAWHLAAAADRPDDEVVAALDAVAERAAARGGHGARAAAWARAAELTGGGPAG